jgi:hypothetical protein
MTIPPAHANRFVSHFVHLDNIPSIIEHGLLSNSEQVRKGIEHHSIALSAIQTTRSTMRVTCGPKGVVHDYVPFYFSTVSPMLLSVVNAKNVDQNFLIHLLLPIQIIQKPTVVFSDASANREAGVPRFFENPTELNRLDWDQIDSRKWTSSSEDAKHRRMAEVLVHKSVPWSEIPRIVVWNDGIKEFVEEECAKQNAIIPQINFDDKYNSRYFDRFMFGEKGKSLVTGPYWTERFCKEAIRRIVTSERDNKQRTFKKLTQLRDAIRADFAAIDELKELIELFTTDNLHREDLATHTQQVVSKLKTLPEYKSLGPKYQKVVELAAYFHDIGKGPKSRWEDKGGRYKPDPDHPVAALPMLERIITEEVEEPAPDEIRLLCKLVCYHDLIGDILGKGRKEEQLFELIQDEIELNALIALSKADVLVVHPAWWDASKVTTLIARAVNYLKTRAPQTPWEDE